MPDVQLKRREVIALANAIKAMDGREKVVNNADGKFVGVLKEPYKFDSAKAVYALAKTAKAVEDEVEAYSAAARAAQRKMEAEKDEEKQAAIDREFQMFSNEVVTIPLHSLAVAELKINTNDIPSSVVTGLLPMLTGEL